MFINRNTLKKIPTTLSAFLLLAALSTCGIQAGVSQLASADSTASLSAKANKSSVKLGDTITFTITATDHSSKTIVFSGIDLAVAPADGCSKALGNTTVKSGASATCTFTYKVTQKDIDAGSIYQSGVINYQAYGDADSHAISTSPLSIKTTGTATKTSTCPTGYFYRDQDKTCVKQSDPNQKITDAYCQANGFDGVKNGTCYSKSASNCVNTDTTCVAPTGGDPAANGGGHCENVNKCDLVSKYIQPLIKFMAALVGVAVVVSIIIGGIQYASSADDPAKVSAAKNRIRNAIIALVTFIFLYALLNFLIPGGLH